MTGTKINGSLEILNSKKVYRVCSDSGSTNDVSEVPAVPVWKYQIIKS